MTTADNKPEDTIDPHNTLPSSASKEKRKSAGFIESTSFRPTWLETGPLSPDMLPPEFLAQAAKESAAGQEPSDDLLAQLAELERLYLESEDESIDASRITDTATTFDDADSAGTPTEEMVVVESVVETTLDLEQVSADSAPELTLPQTYELPDDMDDESFDESFIEEATVIVEEAALAIAEASDDMIDGEAIATTDVAEGDDEPVAVPVAVPVAAVAATVAASPKPKVVKKAKPRREHPLWDGLAKTLLILGLTLLGLAALTYFVNPFARLALSTAELARPVASTTLTNPAAAETNWCVTGSFMAEGAAPLRLQDTGTNGDVVAGDQVFALQDNTIAPGTHSWRVVGCEQGELNYPASDSWIQVDTVGQPVTFMFDSTEREAPLFFPIPFAVSALDSAGDFQVVGSFQDWNPNDVSANLQHLGGGVYQQVRRIARPGIYEAYIIAGSPEQAIDAYGRTSEPIPFSFETNRQSDAVVFLLDTNRGRASVLYGMPWVATQLAYGSGFRILSLALGLGGLLLLGWLLLRLIMMGNDENWLNAGCPECGHHELMRISRRSTDRLLNALGIPAYRYQCRHCTWTGTRLSENGAAVSPGATTIVAEIVR